MALRTRKLFPPVVVFLGVLLLVPQYVDARKFDAPHRASFEASDGHEVGLSIWGNNPDLPGRTAVIFFHGGGWVHGRARQFAPFCRTIAAQSIVCISVTYTLHDGDAVLAQGSEAVGWTRSHAGELGIDPKRIAVGGGSAGGYLAASTAILASIQNAIGQPDALVLLNPVIKAYGSGPPFDLTEKMTRPLPPTLILHGTDDRVSPIEKIRRFADKARSIGSSNIDLIEYPGRGHGFWNFRRGENPDFRSAEKHIVSFLRSIKWVDSVE